MTSGQTQLPTEESPGVAISSGREPARSPPAAPSADVPPPPMDEATQRPCSLHTPSEQSDAPRQPETHDEVDARHSWWSGHSPSTMHAPWAGSTPRQPMPATNSSRQTILIVSQDPREISSD